MPDSNELTERELEILCLVATGASNKEIGQKLFISTNTVKVHLRNIFGKIGVTSRTEAAMYAVNNGLVAGAIPANGSDRLGESSEADLDSQVLEAGDALAMEGPRTLPGPGLNWSTAVSLFLIVIGVLGLAALLRRQTGVQSAGSATFPTLAPRWQAARAMPTARSGLALASYEDWIYAIAGDMDTGVTGVAERYNPNSNTWESLAPKPTPVGDVSAAVIGGKVYLPGGRLASGAVTDVLEVYDTLKNSWESGPHLPVPLSAYALAAFEGRLYLFGGWDGKRTLNSVYSYDPSRDQWVELERMPTARYFAGAAVAAGKIYVIGGYDGVKALKVNEAYLPELDNGVSDPWSEAAPLPLGRYDMGVATLADIIHVVGGQGDAPENVQKALIPLDYFPQQDTWQPFGDNSFPPTCSRARLAVFGTHLHLLGCAVQSKPTAEHWNYQAVYTVVFPVVR